MSRLHPTSREVRGIDARTTVKWLLLGFVYLVMAVFGALGLVALAQGDLDEAGGLVSCFIVLVGGAGLSWSVNRPRAPRHRRGAVLGTAPSGRPAVVIRRGAFMVIGSTASTALAAMLLIVSAVACWPAHRGWAGVLGLLALVLVWPVVVALGGRVRPGGLYLTADGIEHRHDAVSWSVEWEAIRGAVPAMSVAVPLQDGVSVPITTTTPVVWNREVKAPLGVVGIDCRLLGLDGVLVAAAINQAVAFPEQRVELGTPASLTWAMFARA